MKRPTLIMVAALLAIAGAVEGARCGWIHAKAFLAQALLRNSWHRTQTSTEPARPWPWADTQPIARMQLPARDTSMIVLEGASGRTLAFAPGHLHGTDPPGGKGTCVIAGHRDTHFAVLENLEADELIELEDALGVIHTYKVTESSVVHERQVETVVEAGPRTLALVTCWPFDALEPGGKLRWVVWADLLAQDG